MRPALTHAHNRVEHVEKRVHLQHFSSTLVATLLLSLAGPSLELPLVLLAWSASSVSSAMVDGRPRSPTMFHVDFYVTTHVRVCVCVCAAWCVCVPVGVRGRVCASLVALGRVSECGL